MTNGARIPSNGNGILTYRIVPLYAVGKLGRPATGYAINMAGCSKDSASEPVRVARFNMADEARAALAGIPAAHIDDETRA